MGSVYRATQNSMDRDVAIKMIKAKSSRWSVGSETLDKFISEAVVTGGLEHPNIVPIYDVGVTQGGDPFYVMKEVRRRSWSKSIDTASEDENLTTTPASRQCCRVRSRSWSHSSRLEARQHHAGGIRRSLGSRLGIGAGHRVVPEKKGVSFSDGFAGTPAYMAPEMASGLREQISEKSDVYLLGAILFRMLVGKGEQALAICTELYELDPSNSDWLEGVAISQLDLANSLRSAGHDPPRPKRTRPR